MTLRKKPLLLISHIGNMSSICIWNYVVKSDLLRNETVLPDFLQIPETKCIFLSVLNPPLSVDDATPACLLRNNLMSG